MRSAPVGNNDNETLTQTKKDANTKAFSSENQDEVKDAQNKLEMLDNDPKTQRLFTNLDGGDQTERKMITENDAGSSVKPSPKPWYLASDQNSAQKAAAS